MCVDRFARWQDAFPLRDVTAATVACKFVERWIPTFGVPAVMTTDRRAQFEAKLFKTLT